jgi:hypothetical protein
VRYTEKIPEYGCTYTVEKFREAVAAEALVDYNGFGYPIRDGLMSGQTARIRPSNIAATIPPEATHIQWFNR